MSMVAGKVEMNVTPMIDVLLVLIVIFMISPPENPSTGLKAEVPQPPAKSSAPTPESTIVLQVSGNEVIGWRIRLNQEEANIDDLKDRLRAIYKTRASKVLFVRAEGHT